MALPAAKTFPELRVPWPSPSEPLSSFERSTTMNRSVFRDFWIHVVAVDKPKRPHLRVPMPDGADDVQAAERQAEAAELQAEAAEQQAEAAEQQAEAAEQQAEAAE